MTHKEFEAFHEQNPLIYTLLQELALDQVSKGRTHGSIGHLIEQVRHEGSVHVDDQYFAIRNAFRAYYARKLMDETPQLRGFFTIRPSAADTPDPPQEPEPSTPAYTYQ